MFRLVRLISRWFGLSSSVRPNVVPSRSVQFSSAKLGWIRQIPARVGPSGTLGCFRPHSAVVGYTRPHSALRPYVTLLRSAMAAGGRVLLPVLSPVRGQSAGTAASARVTQSLPPPRPPERALQRITRPWSQERRQCPGLGSSAGRQRAVPSGQEKSSTSSHLCRKLWCLGSQRQEASAPGLCAGGLWSCPRCGPAGKGEEDPCGMRLQRASRGAASGWRKAKGPTWCHQGTCEEQNGHWRSQRHEVLLAFQELLGSSSPALPASRDTLREHQGASLAASRRHRGLWARRTALASAATLVLTWQHSPAGNAPHHSPGELRPRSKVTLRTCLVHVFLGKQRDIARAHLQLLGILERAEKSGLWEEFGLPC
ncbi:N(6)-adenosine-methyltransferase non-catalytic subunit METTL14 isoform 7-T19 [Geothlypis trichas]